MKTGLRIGLLVIGGLVVVALWRHVSSKSNSSKGPSNPLHVENHVGVDAAVSGNGATICLDEQNPQSGDGVCADNQLPGLLARPVRSMVTLRTTRVGSTVREHP